MDKRIKKQIESGEILTLFNQKVGLEEISKITHCSQTTVKKVLSHFGIDYDLKRKEDYQNKLDQVVILYKQGKSQLFIEKELGLTRKTIRELLKNKDLKYRDKSEQSFIRYGTELDETVFDELTPDALYWIGLLYADGHIEEKREASIDLVLHKQDMQHLENFKLFLKSNRKVYQPKKDDDCMRLRFNSKKIRDRLIELGFKHDKSYTAIPHELLKHFRDFWRGVVDGDGGVYSKTDKQLSHSVYLCGTLETIFEFIIFCSNKLGIKDKYPSHTKKEGKISETLYQVQYYGEDAKKVAKLLYKDSTTYLERKYQKYLEICEENEVNLSVNNNQ